MYEIGSQERDRKHRQKLFDLQLSEEEWDCVKTCLDLLGVSHLYVLRYDLLIRPKACGQGAASLLSQRRLDTAPVSQRWRCCTSHGQPVSISQSMPTSALPSVLGWTRSRDTIRRPLIGMSTLSPCVCVPYGRCSNANHRCLLVLDPSQEARHLDKFWGKELRQEAVDRAENIVCFSSS